MHSAYDIIKSIIQTEKTTGDMPLNKYTFAVANAANKIEIKKAVEEIYKVKVKNVNTLIMHGKKRRVRYVLGKRPDWKKAVVTLKEGQKIEMAV